MPAAEFGPKREYTIHLRRPYELCAVLLLLSMVSQAGALVMLVRALFDHQVWTVEDILALEPAAVGAATLAFIGLVVGQVLLWTAIGLVRRDDFRIIIGRDVLVLPHRWRAIEVEISYAEVMSVGVHPPTQPTSVRIETSQGNHNLTVRMLPAAWPVAKLANVIASRWREWGEV
jgi:hypothetical protein